MSISSLLHSLIYNYFPCIIISHFPLQFSSVVSWISVTIQHSSHDPAPKQGIQDPSQYPAQHQPFGHFHPTEIVLWSCRTYSQTDQKCRRESVKAGKYVEDNRQKQKKVKETTEGIENGTTEEENYSAGLGPVIAATEFVQDG